MSKRENICIECLDAVQGTFPESHRALAGKCDYCEDNTLIVPTKIAVKTKKEGKHWVCRDCALANRGKDITHIATFHEGFCDKCDTWQVIAALCDYGYPDMD